MLISGPCFSETDSFWASPAGKSLEWAGKCFYGPVKISGILRVEGVRLGIAGLDLQIGLVLGSFRFLVGAACAQV